MAKAAILLMAATMLVATPAARADEIPPTPESLDHTLPCPSVYGTWETAFVIGRLGIEPLAPGEWWGGLLMKATITKDKAALSWMKTDAGEKSSSAYRPREASHNDDGYYFALNAGGAKVSAMIIDGWLLKNYKNYRCQLTLSTIPPGGDRISEYIMRKIK